MFSHKKNKYISFYYDTLMEAYFPPNERIEMRTLLSSEFYVLPLSSYRIEKKS